MEAGEGQDTRAALAAIAVVSVAAIVAAPLLGWPRVVRLPAILVPALVLAVVAARPGRWAAPDAGLDWSPTRRQVWVAALVTGAFLFWYVLTRFHSGQINAIDFTVYFDRPCHQTVHGRPLFVEVSDTPGFSYRSELADHAYWGLLPVCALYAVHPTPLWLHGLSALAVVMGAVHTMRVLQRLGGGGALAAATAFAFVLNDNTARALNYGFHPELFYAWLVPWMLDAGLRGARRTFLVVTLLSVLVKEDACLPLFATAAALAFHRGRSMSWGDRLVFLVFPPALGLANLAAYYGWVLPMLTGDSYPWYTRFWGNYGDTPAKAALGMATRPADVLGRTLTSGLHRTLAPHLFLPLVGWRWSLGTLPIALLYGASANAQLRGFGIYYAIVLVPFFVLAASQGALALARRFTATEGRAQLLAAGVVLGGALLVGSSYRGYSLRPWRAELAAMPAATAALSAAPVVLVQSGLFTRAGYDERFRLLTPETLNDPRNAGAVVLLAPGVSAYPFRGSDLDRLSDLAPVPGVPPELTAVRLAAPIALPARSWRRSWRPPDQGASPSPDPTRPCRRRGGRCRTR
jgi:hypothetical protein